MLKNDLGYTNIITLVIEGSTPRFGEPLYNMLRQMTSIFGNEWWDFMVVGVSKWSYDQDAIDHRNEDSIQTGVRMKPGSSESLIISSKKSLNSQRISPLHLWTLILRH